MTTWFQRETMYICGSQRTRLTNLVYILHEESFSPWRSFMGWMVMKSKLSIYKVDHCWLFYLYFLIQNWENMDISVSISIHTHLLHNLRSEHPTLHPLSNLLNTPWGHAAYLQHTLNTGWLLMLFCNKYCDIKLYCRYWQYRGVLILL